MKVKEYYLMKNEKALDSMQAELSRLTDMWDKNTEYNKCQKEQSKKGEDNANKNT